MTTVAVFKAEQTFADDPVPTLELVAYEAAPKFQTLNEAAAAYWKDAETIADALFASLPGGTIDRLLVEMLSRKSSHFRVPYGTEKRSAPARPDPVNDSVWRTDAAPRGVPCLATVLDGSGQTRVLVATLSPDHNGEVWISAGERVRPVIAWMPAPEPAEPTGIGGRS